VIAVLAGVAVAVFAADRARVAAEATRKLDRITAERKATAAMERDLDVSRWVAQLQRYEHRLEALDHKVSVPGGICALVATEEELALREGLLALRAEIAGDVDDLLTIRTEFSPLR
jgi:hypothetical protein